MSLSIFVTVFRPFEFLLVDDLSILHSYNHYLINFLKFIFNEYITNSLMIILPIKVD